MAQSKGFNFMDLVKQNSMLIMILTHGALVIFILGKGILFGLTQDVSSYIAFGAVGASFLLFITLRNDLKALLEKQQPFNLPPRPYVPPHQQTQQQYQAPPQPQYQQPPQQQPREPFTGMNFDLGEQQ
jgi:hypothetical protein